MPYLSIKTTLDIDKSLLNDFLPKASRTVSELLGKPEQYVMVSIDTSQTMLFAGTNQPTAYLELKSIDLPEDKTSRYSEILCQLVTENFDIDPNRIYIEFSNAPRNLWGWDNKTF